MLLDNNNLHQKKMPRHWGTSSSISRDCCKWDISLRPVLVNTSLWQLTEWEFKICGYFSALDLPRTKIPWDLTFDSPSNLSKIYWRSTSEGASLSRLRSFEDSNKILIKDLRKISTRFFRDTRMIFNKNLVEIFERSQPR